MLEIEVGLEFQSGISIWYIPESAVGLSAIYGTGVFGVDYAVYATGRVNYSIFDLVLCPPPDSLGGVFSRRDGCCAGYRLYVAETGKHT